MKASEMRKGQTIKVDNSLYSIVDFQHVKLGKGGAVYQTKLKSLMDGSIRDIRLRAEESVEEAYLDKRDYEYLYSSGSEHVLMDLETYDQISLDDDAFGDGSKYLKPNTKLQISMYEGRPVVVTLPNSVDLEVTDTPPEIKGATTEETIWEAPVASKMGVGDGECMIIFDDVFVPWERVFLCGEWQFSRDIAVLFGTFHRLFACCRMIPMMETMTGIATLMADYNGLDNYPHIRTKLSWLVQVTEAFKAMSLVACMFPEKERDSDLVNPNGMYTNIAKYMYAENWHQFTKLMQDIAGGIAADPISYKDWMNPEERPYIEKYLSAKDGIPTEHRLRLIN